MARMLKVNNLTNWHLNVKIGGAITGLCLLLAHSALAEPVTYQSHQAIYTAIEHFIRDYHQQEEKIELKIGKLDNRLNLMDCEQHLQISWANDTKTSGRTTIGIECSSVKKWSVFLPVEIDIYKNVVVTKTALQRQQSLTEQDMELSIKNIASLHRGYYTDINSLANFQAKLPISQGSIITPSMLSQVKLVKRGQQVTVLAHKNGISVTIAGTALSDGSHGELVQIRNITSKKIIEAIVTETGVVKIQL